jgi:hypothetical protein
VVVSCEDGNEHTDTVAGGYFLQADRQSVPNEDSAQCS